MSSSSSGDSASGELASLRLKSSSKLDLQSLFQEQADKTLEETANNPTSAHPTRRDEKGLDNSYESEVENITLSRNGPQQTIGDSGSTAINTDRRYTRNITVAPSNDTEHDPFVESPMANSTTMIASPNTKKHFRVSKTVRFRDWEKAPNKAPLKPALKPAKTKKQKSFFHKSNRHDLEERLPSSEYSQTPETSHQLVSPDCYQDNPYSNSSSKYSHLGDIQPVSFKEPLTSLSDPLSSLFSNKEITTPASSEAENMAIENPYDDRIEVDSANLRDEDFDPTQTLARRFNKLSLDTKRFKAGTSQRGFSLRLNEKEPVHRDDLKRIRNTTPEASFDQLDILEQRPPNFPEISNSFKKVSIEAKNLGDLSIPLFDTFTPDGHVEDEKKLKVTFNLLKKVLLMLSTTLEQEIDIKDLSLNEMLSKVEELTESCNNKLECNKIQQIKLLKQLADSEGKKMENMKNEEESRKQILSLKNDIKELTERCSKYESKIASQSRRIESETKLNYALEEQLDKVMALKLVVEQKESFIIAILNLVKESIPETSEQSLLENLKNLNNLLQKSQVENSSLIQNKAKQEIAIKELESYLKVEKGEKNNLQELLNDATAKSIEFENRINDVVSEKKLLELKLHEQTQNIKSLNEKNNWTKNQLHDLQVQLVEANQKNAHLESDIMRQNSNSNENRQIIDEKNKLIDNLNLKGEEQAAVLKTMKSQIQTLSDKKTQIKAFNDSLSFELDTITSKFNHKYEEYESLKKHNEVLLKTRNDAIRQKDEEIGALKKKAVEQEEVQSEIGNELKEIRSKLGEKTAEANISLKKIESLTKNLEGCHEKNRTLRSDILQTSHVKQELKRTLIYFSVSFVKELDGLIDEVSLNTVKESLGFDDLIDLTDEKYIEKLNDIALFIQEAISLVVKEYWNQMKRLSDFQKHNISNPSTSALQRVNRIQVEKLEKLEKKLQYYEHVFKRINFVNERPSTTISTNGRRRFDSRSSKHVPSSTSGQYETLSDSDNESSVKSSMTVNTGILRDKQVEINKLLSKVSQKKLNY
jgi:hypothetical protein